MDKEIESQLQGVMYSMLHLVKGDIKDEANLPENRTIGDVLDWEKFLQFYKALKWALENPEYDFISLLPFTYYEKDEILYFFKIQYDYAEKLLKEKDLI